MVANRFTTISLVLLLLVTGCGGGAATQTGTPSVTLSNTLPAASTPVASPNATSMVTAPATLPAVTPSAASPGTTPQATAQSTPEVTSSPSSTQTTQPANATTFPDPAGYNWVQVASGVEKPTGIAFLPGSTDRFVILSQPGTITLFQNNQALPTLFLDITRKVGSRGNEQGLLGIAFHPQFEKTGYFYINYTDTNGNTVIARYQMMANDPNQADPGSEKVLLRVKQPFANHNGGSMMFGPDGYLYMGLGDGGSGGDPYGNGQNLNTDLGKLLRVDVNQGDPYAIPADNPFAKGGGNPEIWAYGLRNPWRFSFDRLTGDLYIADVGQDQWEEIDFLPAGTPGGTNFGWNYREGSHPYHGNPPAGVHLTDPVFDYSHREGCSVTGGFVYRGQALPEFYGIYLFADYCSGRIWGLLRGADGAWQAQQLFRGQWNITTFGQDNLGELYFVDQSAGGVWRLQKK